MARRLQLRISPRSWSGTVHLEGSATLVAASCMWPTDPWQRIHEMSRDPTCAGVPIAWTMGSWQRRQFASAMARLGGSARIGSGNVPRVKWYECQKPLRGLRHVLGHERVGHVTVVAHGDRAMAALDPAVVLLVHDVAVATGLRVVGQVGPASRVRERVGAQSQRNSENRRDDHNRGVGGLHSDTASLYSQ